ncbi:hypothetical protein ACJMK2_018468 [Sinanodonta woodiana]|uniref:Glutathione S-transferase A n=1 Tax=Sinanodonta woodiana TaxID=1069815 RepID=A0ABD3UDU1_SINWO
MGENMFLYWGSGSLPCWRVMIVLEEKKFGGYPNKLIEFSKEEHKTEEIMKLNPRGQVPTFRDGDIVVNESNAICQYLETRYKNHGTKLIPDDPKEMAAVLQKMYESSNIQENLVTGVVYYQWRTKPEERDEKVFEEKLQKARDELSRWEKHLEQSNTGYIASTTAFSMADIYFYPYVAQMDRFRMDLSKYPNIMAYYERLKNHPSFVSTYPPHWKETDKPDLLSRI